MSEVVVQKNLKNSKSKWVLLLFLIVAIGCGVYYFMQKQNSGMQYDENATIGVLPGVDLDKRKQELQQQLDENMIAFSVNTSPVFVSGTSEGNLMIENPEHNAKILVAELYVDGIAEPIYQSKALKPGSYIENVKLDKVLAAGTYNATVYFKSYNLETEEYIGQTGAQVLLTIQS